MTPHAPRSGLDVAAGDALADAVAAARLHRAGGDAPAAAGPRRLSGRRIVDRVLARMRDDAAPPAAPSPAKTPAGWRDR
jgi:hypothetical protein